MLTSPNSIELSVLSDISKLSGILNGSALMSLNSLNSLSSSSVVGLVVGSYQGCSEELHALAREVAEERARTEWRQMGARSEHEALGIFVHDVHRRWGSVFWRSWARVIRGRLPAIGRPNADILNHGPPPAYARGQAAVGGAEPWPRVQPGVLRGLRAAAGL